MKLFLNTALLLLPSVFYESTTYSLPAKQIEEICQEKRRRSSCIKNMKIKKYNLLKGNRIEIPVIPFKK